LDSRHPIDIHYLERTPLAGGAVSVRLNTLGELETFWRKNRANLPFAAEESTLGGNVFLEDRAWVFAPSKVALVKAVLCWDAFGLGVAYESPGVIDGCAHDGSWTLTGSLPGSAPMMEWISPRRRLPNDPALAPEQVAAQFQELIFDELLDDCGGLIFYDADAFEAMLAYAHEERLAGRPSYGDD